MLGSLEVQVCCGLAFERRRRYKLLIDGTVAEMGLAFLKRNPIALGTSRSRGVVSSPSSPEILIPSVDYTFQCDIDVVLIRL